MKFLLLTLIAHHPDPISGVKTSAAARLREVIDTAVLAEELGFDGFAVGERHEDPFISSSPPVVLSNIAARTSTIALFTAVTTLSLLDPVRAFEDYSTLDNLSEGRLELIIGKGNGTAQAQLFSVTAADQWDRNREGYELFRRLWASERVTWSGRFRPPLVDAKALPTQQQVDQILRAARENKCVRAEFGVAADTLLDFVWYKVCDWYVEATKAKPPSATRAPAFLRSGHAG